MLRSTAVMLFCLAAISLNLLGQNISDSKLQEFLQRWGKGQTQDPRTMPVYLSTGAMEMVESKEIEGMRIWIGSEGVHLWQGDINQPIWELVCDQAVIWFKPLAQESNAVPPNVSLTPSISSSTADASIATPATSSQNSLQSKLRSDTAQLYAEGNVHFRWADHYFHGTQLYFDFVKNQGVVNHGILRTTMQPLIDSNKIQKQDRKSTTFNIQLRAEQLRIYSAKEIEADHALISPCQFGDPHYHFQSQEIRIVRLTEQDKVYVTARQNHIEAYGIPFFYIPYIAGENFENWPLKSIQVGKSSKWGYYLLTTWGGNLYQDKGNKTGLSKVEWLLDLDTRQKRGFAGGPHLIYQGAFPQDSQFTGKIRGYYAHDQPLSELGSTMNHQPEAGDEATWDRRHWIYGVHRHRFANDYFLDLEISDLSDRDFQRDFFEREFREDKEPETYIYLRKYWSHHAATLLGRWRLNDYQNQIEYMPQGSHEAVYLPVFPDTFRSLYWSHRVELSEVRRNDDEEAPTLWDNSQIFRSDLQTNLSYPFSIGPIHFLPFVTGRLSYFEEDRDGESDAFRVSGEFGIEAGVNFHRYFDWKSSFFQVDRVLHVLTPKIRYHWIYANSLGSEELIPFDEMDQYDEMQSVDLVITNRFRTIRDGKVADFFWSEVTLRYFVERPTYNKPVGYNNRTLDRFDNLEVDLLWYIRSNWWIKTETEYNFSRNVLDSIYVRCGYDLSDTITLWVDQRYKDDTKNLSTASIYYSYNEKWAFQVYAQYDWRQDQLRECKFKVRRFFHCFALDLVVKYDNVDNNTAFTAEFYPTDLISPQRD